MFASATKALFGDGSAEQKVSFRKKLERLSREKIGEEDPFWSTFWLVLDSPADATVLIPAEEIRLAIESRPHNIAFLVQRISAHLFDCFHDSAFPTKRFTVERQLLNCLRVLTRLFPIIYENINEDDVWLEDVLWRQDGHQFVIDEEETSASPSLASRLYIRSISCDYHLYMSRIAVAVDLLFTIDFTLPANAAIEGDPKTQYIIWEPGIGTSTHLVATKANLACRTEVLKFILAMLSSTVYAPTNSNRMLDLFTSSIPRRTTLTLLCSLLNTALAKSSPASLLNPAEAFNKLSTLALGADPKQADELAKHLPTVAFHLLNLLVLPKSDSIVSPPVSPIKERGFTADNLFLHYISKLHRTVDMQFLWDGLINNLNAPPPATIALLPSATASPGITEAVTLLWRLLECNARFTQFMLHDNRGPTLIVLLLNICLEHKDQPAALGLVRLCAYVLQTLTAERGITSQSMLPIERIALARKHVTIPSGAVIDHLIASIYTLVFESNGKVSTLYPALILSITNCSPYIRALSETASTNLLQLFLAFSSPTFLLADDGNPRLVYFLLEGLNNVIHHHLADNPFLIYAILRSHRRFESLATFTLSRGVDEIRGRPHFNDGSATDLDSENSVRPELKESLSSLSLHSARSEDKLGEDDPPRLSDKARGKLRERSSSTDSRPDSAAGPYVSRTGFTPTEAWVSSWREHMPLDSILLMITELQPKVASLTSTASKSTTKAILDFLKSVSLRGILPPAPVVKLRPFQHSTYSRRWLNALCWGVIYLASPQMYAGTEIKLFSVQQTSANIFHDA